MKNKLFFIIPSLIENTPSHYWHVYELLQEVSKKMKVVLFAESGNLVPLGNLENIYIQKFQLLPFRILERTLVFMIYLLKGYKNIYIQQSVFSSLLASILAKIFKGETYFWHCGKISIYEKEKKQKDWLFRINLKFIDHLVTAHKSMKDYYQKYFTIDSSKISIFPGWVNVDRFKQVEKKQTNNLKKSLKIKKRKIILFAHWLSPRKGSRTLPKIIHQTAKTSKNLLFLIVGGGPDKIWLEEKIEILKLGEKVILTGEIANQKMPLYFNIADVFIMPSREEELGRVQLEAMASGIPIVAFKTMGSDQVLSKVQKKLMVKNGDIKAFVKAIKKALAMKKYFQKENQKQVKKYSLQEGCNNFLKLFN